MGVPPSTPQATYPSRPLHPITMNNRLTAQHERLILELLPFKEPQLFHEWLQGEFVRGSFREFCRDFLSSHPGYPDPDKEVVAKAVKDAINAQTPKFLMYHPEKADWTGEDHHIRFIVTVVQDNVLKGMWSITDIKRKVVEIARAVFEVLCYLKATMVVTPDHNPPGYSQ